MNSFHGNTEDDAHRVSLDIIDKLIQELKEDIAKVERAIASLEQLRDIPSLATEQRSRRGRKAMDPEERKAVSARMKAYWARVRKG